MSSARNYLIAFCFLAMGASGAALGQTTAKAELAAAEATAKKEHKNVFVIFHASWCGWCHKLEGLMDSPKFKPLFEANYVVAPIDIQEHDAKHPETPGGEELAKELGATDQGLPFYAILSPAGKILKDSRNGASGNIGYPGEPHEITYFIGMLQATAPHARGKEVAALEQFLRQKP